MMFSVVGGYVMFGVVFSVVLVCGVIVMCIIYSVGVGGVVWCFVVFRVVLCCHCDVLCLGLVVMCCLVLFVVM